MKRMSSVVTKSTKGYFVTNNHIATKQNLCAVTDHSVHVYHSSCPMAVPDHNRKANFHDNVPHKSSKNMTIYQISAPCHVTNRRKHLLVIPESTSAGKGERVNLIRIPI